MTKQTRDKLAYFASSIFLSLLCSVIFGEFFVALTWLTIITYKLDKLNKDDLPEQKSIGSSDES